MFVILLPGQALAAGSNQSNTTITPPSAISRDDVRAAIQQVFAAKDRMGGVGYQVTCATQQFSDSYNLSLAAEDRINSQNIIVKWILGGDMTDADMLVNLTSQNVKSAQQIQGFLGQCGCTHEVRTDLQPAIRIMADEQVRLLAVANAEEKNTGIMGLFSPPRPNSSVNKS